MAGNTITIRTDPEITQKIETLAMAMNRSRNWVIEDALKQYIETQAWQIEGVKEAMAAMDRGEGIAHEDVMAEMDALIKKEARQQ